MKDEKLLTCPKCGAEKRTTGIAVYTTHEQADKVGHLMEDYRTKLLELVFLGTQLKTAGYTPPQIMVDVKDSLRGDFFGTAKLQVDLTYMRQSNPKV
jgi:hypothetical protein